MKVKIKKYEGGRESASYGNIDSSIKGVKVLETIVLDLSKHKADKLLDKLDTHEIVFKKGKSNLVKRKVKLSKELNKKK